LRWLAAHQAPDGGWSARDYTRQCRHHKPCRGEGIAEFDIGVTALAVLAFLGAGHSPSADGPYRRQVSKAIEYLQSNQDAAGAFGAYGDRFMYNHAIATFAVSEAYGMSGIDRCRDSAEAALRYCLASQQSGGGWDYSSEHTNRNDLSITGWIVMALRSAEDAGLPVPQQEKASVRRFLDRAFTASGLGIYADREPEAGRQGINMVAVALLTHFYLDGSPNDPRVRAAVRRLVPGHVPDAREFSRWDRSFQSFYYWYTATLCLFHLGGAEWEGWNTLLQRSLLPLQSRGSHVEGSWDPEPSWIGMSGGRVYATAINVLSLEVYYRYKPLFASPRP
jgi:hypothetical protein